MDYDVEWVLQSVATCVAKEEYPRNPLNACYSLTYFINALVLGFHRCINCRSRFLVKLHISIKAEMELHE